MAKKFSKVEAIRFGWQTMKQNIGFFIRLLIVAGLIYIIPDIVGSFLRAASPVLAFIVNTVIGGILGIIVALGLIKISLNFCDSIKSKFGDLFSQYRLFFRFLFASLLYGLITFAGFILLVIPGIYLAMRLQFYRYFIVDKGSLVTESLKKSWEVTRGSAWNLFIFGLLLGLINLAGALVFLVGLFATLPTTFVAVAFVYRKLLAQLTPQAPTPAPPSPSPTVSPPPSEPTPPAETLPPSGATT